MPTPDLSTPRSPRLLAVVYGTTVALLALSGAALAILGSDHVRTDMTAATVAGDQAAIADFVTTETTPDEARDGVFTQERAAQLRSSLAAMASRHGLLRVWAFGPDGKLLLASQANGAGPAPDGGSSFGAALTGSPSARIDSRPESTTPAVLTEDLPVLVNGGVRFVFVVERDAAPIVASASAAWREVLLVTLGGALILAGLLYVIFGAANTRLRRQHEQLLEAMHTDGLTGLLNHGSVVGELTSQVAKSERDAASLGIVLLDIDNFRLLNDVHGEAAGDMALRHVADALREQAEGWAALGRYGPDEFLVIAPGASARELAPSMQRLQERLGSVSLQLGASDPLPLTVSAGISYFPFHAASVTELVSAAAVALSEAKVSGGSAVRIADTRAGESRATRSSLSVLQGLVQAIDTKDHYTKRHSEDVACYALFLASWIGLSMELRQTLGVAALLHDVGKIGIPDEILRKPGRLTSAEYDTIKQHVVLGDLIVRDLPDIDGVRAGIRHHHERWDGSGYPDGLAGDDIPLVARILSVADAFSAMTTTRPYRKALPLEEAIQRLAEAAGSQLDSKLVGAFRDGIEHAPDAPLPGSNRQVVDLWTPNSWAA